MHPPEKILATPMNLPLWKNPAGDHGYNNNSLEVTAIRST